MKVFQLFLLLIVAAFPLISCKAQTASAEGSPNAPTPTSLPQMGKWEISFNPIKYFPSRPGWRNFRIEIVLTNGRDDYSSATINTQGAKVHTSDDYDYDLHTLKTTGASAPITVTTISFNSIIPKGYRMVGEFNKEDQVVSYCFQAEIPNDAQPRYIYLPNFDGARISIDSKTTGFLLPDKTINFRDAGKEFEIKDRALITVTAFTREHAWPMTNDLIAGVITITNLTKTLDSSVNLSYLPITNDGIVGAAYTDTPNCKPNFVAPPARVVASTICALVPRGTLQVHMIFSGDARVVYETQLK